MAHSQLDIPQKCIGPLLVTITVIPFPSQNHFLVEEFSRVFPSKVGYVRTRSLGLERLESEKPANYAKWKNKPGCWKMFSKMQSYPAMWGFFIYTPEV